MYRYLYYATGQRLSIVNREDFDKKDRYFIIGLPQDMGIALPKNITSNDDWIFIKPDKRGYVLSGSNPRSVLFAVYRYLQEIGFRWIRPGKRGEIIPRLKRPFGENINVAEGASYRYRTICIEGACSYEHVRDLIDWAAKFGMNGYFIQFDLGMYFWRRWYQYTENPYRKARELTMDEGRRIVEKVIKEIKNRDLRLERVGHGWTCAALGLSGEGWEEEENQKVPLEKKRWVTEINGKREFWGGIPLNTNLCYSNPDVRKAITDAIVSYAAKHPEVDAIHFWLADGSNNNCECRNCKKSRPSDFYVDMLNELDRKLSSAGLNTKIVFLTYVDLLWPPLKNRIRNQNRFIMMFAPITRSYLYSFFDSRGKKEQMTQYARNKLQFPKSARGNIKYLRAWQKDFKGSGFDFDYHLIWPLYFDINQFALASILYKDLQNLEKMELDGFNSCQVQRVSFPHNLLMDVMARTLWNKKLSFDEIVKATFSNAYGKDWMEVCDYFKNMSYLWRPFFEPVFIPKPDEKRIKQGLKNIIKMKRLISQFKHVLAKNIKVSSGSVLWSWRYIEQYLKLIDLLIPAFESYLNCYPDTKQKFEHVFNFLWQNEKDLHPVLDVTLFINVLKNRINEVENTLKSTTHLTIPQTW